MNRKREQGRGKNGSMGGEGKEGDFQKFEILTASMHCSAICITVPNFVQVGQAVPVVWPFIEFFKMAAVRHLGFSKDGNLNCRYPSEGQNASSCQILCRSVEPLRRYGRLQFFKMAAVRHLRFLKVQNFNCPYPLEGQSASSCLIFCKWIKALQR